MMDLHRALVLTHVVAMIGLFSTLTVEGVAVIFMRRSTTYEQAREWARLWTLLPAIGAPSIVLSVASGIYLATMVGLWDFRWTQVGVPTLLLVAIAGGVTGPRRSRLRAALRDSGTLSVALREDIRSPVYSTSWIVRAALLSGLVIDMVIKPDRAIGLLALVALLDVLNGQNSYK
jgi:hypothetical protein